MRKPIKIPQRVDEFPHFLLWSLDEMAPLMFLVLIGMLFDALGICLVLGLVATNAYRRIRENSPDGILLHTLYKMGIPLTKSKTMVNIFIRRLFP